MLEIDLRVFPLLTTQRLQLRELVQSDAPALFTMRSDARVMAHIGRPRHTTLEETQKLIGIIAQDRIDNAGITWVITLKGSDTLIGTIGYYRLKKEHYRGEVGYMLSPDHWGQGLMGEALEAVVSFGFDRLGFHSIEAVTDPRNAASNKLLERRGFVREGLFKENYYWNGEFQDSAVYSLLKAGPVK